ncbi:MAG: hypothetical protein BMS9Abin05_2213 [Rhodothermia bacterium]|nr:MAG: hypothetical protein BMS9Abin05_2213 [Rhodothermia bacterium]
MGHRSTTFSAFFLAIWSVNASAQQPNDRVGRQGEFYQLHGQEIVAYFDDITGTPVRTLNLNGVKIGTQAGMTYPTPESAVAAVETLISNHLDLFRFDPSVLSDPVVESITSLGASWYVWYIQIYEGLPVFSSLVAVTITLDGTIKHLSAQVYPDISINTTPILTPEDAEASVRDIVVDSTPYTYGASEYWEQATLDSSELIVRVDENNKQYLYSLAWNLWFVDPEGGRGQSIVDAHTGEVYSAFGGPLITNNESPDVSDLPAAIELYQNYPNPFRAETIISYRLAQAAEVRLTVVDLLGRTVAAVEEGHRQAGLHLRRFNASRLSNGTYIYRLQVDGAVTTRIMVLNR